MVLPEQKPKEKESTNEDGQDNLQTQTDSEALLQIRHDQTVDDKLRPTSSPNSSDVPDAFPHHFTQTRPTGQHNQRVPFAFELNLAEIAPNLKSPLHEKYLASKLSEVLSRDSPLAFARATANLNRSRSPKPSSPKTPPSSTQKAHDLQSPLLSYLGRDRASRIKAVWSRDLSNPRVARECTKSQSPAMMLCAPPPPSAAGKGDRLSAISQSPARRRQTVNISRCNNPSTFGTLQASATLDPHVGGPLSVVASDIQPDADLPVRSQSVAAAGQVQSLEPEGAPACQSSGDSVEQRTVMQSVPTGMTLSEAWDKLSLMENLGDCVATQSRESVGRDSADATALLDRPLGDTTADNFMESLCLDVLPQPVRRLIVRNCFQGGAIGGTDPETGEPIYGSVLRPFLAPLSPNSGSSPVPKPPSTPPPPPSPSATP